MPEKKGATPIDGMTLKDSREMNYEVASVNKSSSLTQGEDEEVADGLSDNSTSIQKDAYPQLCG